MSYTPIYFSRTEFNMCTPSCELEDMNPEFLRKLDDLRRNLGFPLTLSCAYRSVEHDKKKGRSGNSYHCKGRAVDIICRDSYKRAQIVQKAPWHGFKGIGVSKSFVHLDDRPCLTLWTYD